MDSKRSDLIRFDSFMHQALHDPQRGYYARKIKSVGTEGDFSTTATLSNLLGKAVASSFLNWQQKSNSPLNFIEVGGGDGSFAASLLKALPFFKRWKTRYHLVDSSSPLSRVQKKKLKRSVTYHDDINSALQSCAGVAFIFSNELVDAFPVRIFQRSDTGWDELFLKGAEEVFIEASEFPQSSSFDLPKTNPNERVEIHESYHEWLQQWTPQWKSGQMLTIDYGDIFPDVYYRMPKGTLRAYYRHQHITGNAVYLNPGHQDITADVNFTDLIQWGEKLSIKTQQCINQSEYLTDYASQTSVDQYLIDPFGPGSAFKVLLQQKS